MVVFQIPAPAALGLFSGATTNTPSLGAAQQTLVSLKTVSPDALLLPALAYAVSYPGAIVGIILTMLTVKAIYRIDPLAETSWGRRSFSPRDTLMRSISPSGSTKYCGLVLTRPAQVVRARRLRRFLYARAAARRMRPGSGGFKIALTKASVSRALRIRIARSWIVRSAATFAL